MVKISTIIALGIFIAIIPFTGLPNNNPYPVKNILFIACGLLVSIMAILIRKELEAVIKHLHTDVVKTDTFTDSNPSQLEEEN